MKDQHYAMTTTRMNPLSHTFVLFLMKKKENCIDADNGNPSVTGLFLYVPISQLSPAKPGGHSQM